MMKKNNVSKYSEDWIPIKQILNGMIQTDDGYFVTGVKVMPKNIFMYENARQENIIYNLRTFYNSVDYEFWLIIADRPVDMSVYLAQLQIMYNNSKSSIRRKLILQDINKANSFMSASYNVVDTEYFIIFKEKKMELVQKKLHNIIAGLANCDLNSSQTTNEDLRMLLDNFLNGGTTTSLRTVMSNVA